MIKFFSKIRQQLLAQNKLSKYLIYAIGEIVLVVIGILIALSINNWNQSRIQDNLEQTYLASLLDEFQGNLQEFYRVQKINANNLENAVELAKYTGPGDPTITDKQFSELLLKSIFNEVQYRPGTGILNEVINSGKLSIIKNPELKNALASLDGLMLRIRFQENLEHGATRLKLIALVESDAVSLRKMSFSVFGEIHGVKDSKFQESNLGLLQSKEFDNILVTFIYTGSFLQENYYTTLERKLLEIINILERQII